MSDGPTMKQLRELVKVYGPVINGPFTIALDEGRIFRPFDENTRKDMSKEAGFKVPVYISAKVQGLCHPPKNHSTGQSYNGRMWDVLSMASMTIKMGINKSKDGTFQLLKVRLGRSNQILKIISGPGDSGEHVLLIQHSDENVRDIIVYS